MSVGGIPSFGRILVDLNFRLSPAELGLIADDCQVEALVVDSDQLEVGRGLLLEALEREPVDLTSLEHVQYAASPIAPSSSPECWPAWTATSPISTG